MRRLHWLAAAVLCLGCSTDATDVASLDAGQNAGGQGGGLDGGGFGGEGGGAGGAGGFGGQGGGFGGAGGNPNQGNQRPTLQPIGDREIEVGTLLEIELEATDPEQRPVSFNVRSTLPEGAKFNKADGIFSWTPNPAQQGIIQLITFEASDGELKDQETITISVLAAGQGGNRAPVLEALGDQVLTEGEAFELTVQATDPNGDALTYSLGGEELAGATLDPDTGAFAWTPPRGSAGQSYTATFTVTDGELEATVDVKFAVREAGGMGGGNLPPRITPIEVQTLTVGVPYSLTIEATDDRPASLNFSTAGALPAGARFDSATATLMWTATPAQADQAFAIVFQVSDGEFRAVQRASFQVVSDGGNMGGECNPDAGEANDAPAALISGQTIANRSICPADDRDAYVFESTAGEGISLRCAFSTAAGDLDMVLTAPSGLQFVAESTTDNEELLIRAPETGDYTVEIYGYEATNPRYSLSLVLDAEGPPECVDDGLDNHSPQTAAPLEDAGDAMQICSGVSDFYGVDLEVGTLLTVLVGFVHADGDIDVTLTGPGDIQAQAGSSDDDELIDFVAPQTGQYILEVFGFSGDENTYGIDFEITPPAACDTDRVEPNDALASAEPLQANLYRNLTNCGEPDWYKTQVPAGDFLQVYVSFDGPAPQLEGLTPASQRIAGQTYAPSQADGCQAGRDGCRLLQLESPGGWVYYRLGGGQVGQDYDVNVRIAVAGTCALNSQICAEDEICDYPNAVCADIFCDADSCPGDYLCHQEWCVELCNDDGSCPNPRHSCKLLAGFETCGLAGPAALGEACGDFSDCSGAQDCLTNAPDGYCSQTCVGDGECGAGRCGRFDDGNFCGATCQGDGDCRAGYRCGQIPGAGGGQVQICTPR